MIRVAVVGLGGISGEHFQKLERIEGVRVAGICDLSETLVRAVGDRFGVGPGFTDYEDMLERVEPDAVHVLTPPQSHSELVLSALEAQADVLVEKPISTTLAEYEAMRDAAVERERMLVENYNYRFVASVLRALDLVRSGSIGEVVTVDVTMSVGLTAPIYMDAELPHFAHSLPGGALRNFASHPASLLVAMLGPHREVSVMRRREHERSQSDDELRALVELEGGVATLTLTSHSQPPWFGMTVRATRGTIEIDIPDRRLHVDRAGSPVYRLANPVRHGMGYLTSTTALLARSLTASQDYFEGFERLLNEFYRAMQRQSGPPVSIEEMDGVNRLVEALFADGATR